MIKHEKLIPYAEKYRNMPMTGLLVRCWLGTAYANYEPIMIDNIIANAVVQEATRGAGLPDEQRPYELPIPLKTVWHSSEGLPLYAASTLLESEEHIKDTVYLHKRAPHGRHSYAKKGRINIETIKGRWMERRVPMPTKTGFSLHALCIGNAEEVERLLSYIPHIGKRRNSGFGYVKRWEVEEVDMTTVDTLIQNGKTTRPIPIVAREILGDYEPYGSTGLLAFSPPYWLRGLATPCWVTGSPVEEVQQCV